MGKKQVAAKLYQCGRLSKTACSQVLVIDKVPLIRLAIINLVNQLPDFMVCGEAGNRADGIKAINLCRPDIVITDLSSVPGNGTLLNDDFSNDYLGLPVLVFSDNVEPGFTEKCINAGARGVVLKTEPTDRIITAMRKLLQGKIYISESAVDELISNYIHMGAGNYA